MTVAERVAATIAGRGLLAPGAPVLALLSGGGDSTLLVALLAEIGHDVRALHVAHAQRGAASEADADGCRALCAQLAVPLAIVPGAVEPGPNLEARLRDVRRRAALAARGDDPVATGHTATDRAETVLYRLATSGGVRALPALPHRDPPFVRPLLDLEREEVRAELARRGLPFADDATNADRRLARNRVRHEVLPQLSALNPAAVRNIARAAGFASDERDLVDGLAAELLAADGSVDLARLRACHVALQRATLRLAAARQGITLAHRDVEALRALGLTGAERRSLHGGARALRSYGRLTFARGAEAPAPTAPACALPVPGEVGFGALRVRAELAAGDALDPALAGRLLVRPRRDGDRLAGRRRPVADLLQRARIAHDVRAGYPVVEADGELVCVPGVAVAPGVRRTHGVVVSTLRAP
jgi:tRNA(Ile)-lysidine synthase